jgi:hypothetical protein
MRRCLRSPTTRTAWSPGSISLQDRFDILGRFYAEPRTLQVVMRKLTKFFDSTPLAILTERCSSR